MIQKKTFPWSLLWLFLLFVVPLGSASLLYIFQDRISFKIIPHGELLTPPIPVATLGFIPTHAAAKGKWQLVYLCRDNYQQACEADYNLVTRVHLSLGKDQDRVYLHSANLEFLKSLPLGHRTSNEVLLIDPRGFLIMRYAVSTEKTEKYAKGMLEDMKRLLRFSHVG